MRNKIIAANWKMNLLKKEAIQVLEDISKAEIPKNAQVIVAPPVIYLSELLEKAKKKGKVLISAQNCHQKESGAYTGEVSASMLKSIGIEWIIIGHSERREYYSESNKLILEKLKATTNNGMNTIFCIGEPMFIRNQNRHFDFVENQLRDTLMQLTAKDMDKMVIAYEPIWAIGTGETATPQQAQEMHAFIRALVRDHFGTKIGDNLRIIYGGSCKPNNAKELFSMPDIDGALVGGASLVAKDFIQIIQAAK